ncbi:hypothetical protein MMC22_009542 [Lobaria immixta]|nr:hypothetical protein [Lobaria immixta]
MATRNSDQLWNPYNTLDLHSLGGNFSCVGSAISRGNARCRWSIHSTMQQQARQKLDAMAVEHPSSRAVTIALQEIVLLLLCSEVHQKQPEQRSAKVSEWSVKVQDVAVELEIKREMISQIQQLKADLSRYQEAQGQLESKLIASRAIQDATSSRIMTLEADLAARKTKLQEFQHLLKEKDTILLNQQSSAAAKTTLLQHDLKTTKSKLQETQLQLQESKSSFEEHQSSASSKILKLEIALEEAKSNVGSNLKTQLQEVENQLKEKDKVLQNHQSSAAAKTSALQRDLETTDAELQETRRQLHECKSSFEEHKSSVSSQIIEPRTALEEAGAQSSMQSSANSNLKVELEEVQHQLLEKDAILQNHKSSDAVKNSALQRDLDTTKDELQQTQRQLHESKKSLEEHKSASFQTDTLKTARKEAGAQTTRQSSPNYSLEAQLQEVQHKLKEKESDAIRTSALQRELNTTKAELRETQRQLDESKKGLEEHQSSASSKILKLETALEGAKAQTSKQSRENSNLEAQLQDTRTTYNRKLDAFKKGRITKGAFVIYASRRSRIWYRDTEAE